MGKPASVATEFVAHKLAWHEQVVTDPALNHLACRVASVILHRLSRNGDCFPSLEYLAKAVGTYNPDSKNKGRSTIQRALKELVARGHLEIVSGRLNATGRRLPNVYVPVLKAVTAVDDEPHVEVAVTASRGQSKPVDKADRTTSRDHMKCADRPHEVCGVTASCGTNPYNNPESNPSRARGAPKKLGRVEPGGTSETNPEPAQPRRTSVPIPLARHLARLNLPRIADPPSSEYATADDWSGLIARLKGGA